MQTNKQMFYFEKMVKLLSGEMGVSCGMEIGQAKKNKEKEIRWGAKNT